MRKFIIIFCILILTSHFALGQAWVWGTEASYGGNDEGMSVATDKLGNVYLTGDFYTALAFSGDTIVSNSANTYLVKFNPLGQLLWLKQSYLKKAYNSEDYGNLVTTDKNDNVYLTGTFHDSTMFGPYLLTTPNGWAAFFVKYDSAGNVLWAKQAKNGTSYGNGIAPDQYGNVYATGTFYGNILLGTNSLTANDTVNIFIAKYDTGGKFIWSKVMRSSSLYTSVSFVTTDLKGNTYITGGFSDSLSFGSKSIYSPTADIYVAKFNPSGNIIWAIKGISSNINPHNGNWFQYNEVANCVVTDKSGNAYIIGGFNGLLKIGTSAQSTPTHNNIFICKIDSTGKLLWLKQPTRLDSNDWIGYVISTDTNNHFFISAGSSESSPETYTIGFDSLQFSAYDQTGDGVSLLYKI